MRSRSTLTLAVAAVSFLACSHEPSEEPAAQADAVTSGATSGFDVLATGAAHTCMIARRGARCWGGNGSGQGNVPTLRRPRAIVAGDSHSCALDDDGVKCWGSAANQVTTVPA